MRPRSCGGWLALLKVVWDGSAPLITSANLPHLSPPPSGPCQLRPLRFVPEDNATRSHISRELITRVVRECLAFAHSQIQKIPFEEQVRDCTYVRVCCLLRSMLWLSTRRRLELLDPAGNSLFAAQPSSSTTGMQLSQSQTLAATA